MIPVPGYNQTHTWHNKWSLSAVGTMSKGTHPGGSSSHRCSCSTPRSPTAVTIRLLVTRLTLLIIMSSILQTILTLRHCPCPYCERKEPQKERDYRWKLHVRTGRNKSWVICPTWSLNQPMVSATRTKFPYERKFVRSVANTHV